MSEDDFEKVDIALTDEPPDSNEMRIRLIESKDCSGSIARTSKHKEN